MNTLTGAAVAGEGVGNSRRSGRTGPVAGPWLAAAMATKARPWPTGCPKKKKPRIIQPVGYFRDNRAGARLQSKNVPIGAQYTHIMKSFEIISNRN